MLKQAQYRLLVVRLGAMGDILHALPAITALRKAHPWWRIDWAVEPRWLPLLSSEGANSLADSERGGESGADCSPDRSPARPLVDRIYPVRTKVWQKKPFSSETLQGIGALRTALRSGEYEAVIDFQGALKSAVVARLSGSRRIIGEASPRESIARWFFSERVKTTGLHVIEQDVELASAVAGDLLKPMSPKLPVDEAAEGWCERFAELRNANRVRRPVILLHPGGGWGAKRWPADRFGAVAEEFAQRGALVLVNAAPGEEILADAVAKAANGQALVIGASLAQLIEMTRRVSLVIGGDTGPLHLACALGKPVVGIYGPTDPRRNGPYGSRFLVLRNPDSRQDYSRREQPEAGLLTIRPDSVVAAGMELLLAERRGKAASGPGIVLEERRW